MGFFKKKRTGALTLKDKLEEHRVIGIYEKKQAKIREQKQKAFKGKIKRFRQAGERMRKKAGGYGDTGFGISQEDLFFGSERPRKRKKTIKRQKRQKRIRRQRPDDEMYGDLGTDRYW